MRLGALFASTLLLLSLGSLVLTRTPFSQSDAHAVGNEACIECHEHRQSEMDDEHERVTGYVWASPSCYGCHPDGRK